VTLRRAGRGTDLVHEIRVQPRGALGRAMASWEIGYRLRRRATDVYRRIDEAAAGGAPDPFDPPHAPSRGQRERVAQGMDQLCRRGTFAPAIVRRLAELLLFAPDKKLERLRPHALADAWAAPRAEVLDLFLHAAGAGLLDVAWDLLCPGCYVAHEVRASLGTVTSQGACHACGERYTRDLAGSVELIFRPHRAVRAIGTATYCVGSPALRPHVLAQQILAPGERRQVVVDLPRSGLQVSAERWPGAAELGATPLGISAACTARIVPGGVDLRPAVVRAGEVTLTLANDTDRHQVVRLETPPQRSDAVMASTAMTHPSFQGMVSEASLACGEHLTVSRMAFLVVEVADRAHLFHERGDAPALARVEELADLLAAAVAQHQGTVFRQSYERTLAAFARPASALRAALAVAASGRPAELGCALRVAVHAGRCLALTTGARRAPAGAPIEYFGETIERTAALLPESRPGSVAVSQAIEEDPAALAAMHEPPVARRVAVTQGGPYGGRRVIRLVVGA
jgi:hypothetical protein